MCGSSSMQGGFAFSVFLLGWIYGQTRAPILSLIKLLLACKRSQNVTLHLFQGMVECGKSIVAASMVEKEDLVEAAPEGAIIYARLLLGITNW